MCSSAFKINAAKSTPSAHLPPSVLTPSPTLDKRAANKKRKCKVKHDSDQLTLTQMYPLSPPDSDLLSTTTTPTTTTTVPIMDSASLSFNAHKYKHLAEADPLNLVKIYDVVQHNIVIQKELHDLDRLCALREEPSFSSEKGGLWHLFFHCSLQ